MINVFQPSLGKEELERISQVFASNWIGRGSLTKEFEEIFAKYIGSTKDHLVTAHCCSEGLFSSMHLCEIQPDDEVIVPDISFVGAGNAVCANGSKLVLCDVDKRTLNVRAEDIEKVITSKTKAVILLHFGGVPCEMDEIMKLAELYQLKVIEDCAASVCSSYKGKAVGTFGDIGIWSFDAMKILVCGDGAAIHFKNPEMKERAARWLYFGLETKSGFENSVAQKWWEFDVSSFGHRSIWNDITAAMALEQYKKLPEFMKKRRQVHQYYDEVLKGMAWIDRPLPLSEECKSSYYFYHIQVNNGKRDELASYLRKNEIYTTYRYFPLHRVSGYGISGEFPNADYAADNTLCLPMHQNLSIADLELVTDKIKEFGQKYC